MLQAAQIGESSNGNVFIHASKKGNDGRSQVVRPTLLRVSSYDHVRLSVAQRCHGLHVHSMLARRTIPVSALFLVDVQEPHPPYLQPGGGKYQITVV